MEHGRNTEFSPKMLQIASKLLQGLGRRLEQ
jgi:hypothetical protein